MADSASHSSPTLRTSIAVLVLLIGATCFTVGAVAFGLYAQGIRSQAARAQAATEQTCEEIQSLYLKSTPGKNDPFRLDLASVILKLVLVRAPGIEGGVWNEADGFVAYAFPTYETGLKEDTPPAEQARIADIAQRSLEARSMVSEQYEGALELRLLSACMLTAKHAAWVMLRVDAQAARSAERWALALTSLSLLILAVGGWHIHVLLRWSRALDRIVITLTDLPADVRRDIEPSGHADLDQVIRAFNAYSARLGEALKRSQGLEQDLRQAERSALIGRMVASLAHEIRNPLGAMRLKAENALAGGAERHAPALDAVLVQIERLEGLLTRLLSLARPFKPELQDVDVGAWLKQSMGLREEQARAAGVNLESGASAIRWRFDPVLMDEALDNLIQNALQHTPPGGAVRVQASADDKTLKISVSDSGPGVSAELRPHLFQPFASGRRGGTGFGLAAARDILAAHGGSLRLLDHGPGATFEIELPWQPS